MPPAASPRTPLLDAFGLLLADLSAVAARARVYQWNVVGPTYPLLRGVFAEQHAALNSLVDRVAGRIRGLGAAVTGDLAELAALTRLPARPRQPGPRDMVAGLLADLDLTANQIRVSLLACGADRTSADLLARVLMELEELAAGLRAFLEMPADGPG